MNIKQLKASIGALMLLVGLIVHGNVAVAQFFEETSVLDGQSPPSYSGLGAPSPATGMPMPANNAPTAQRDVINPSTGMMPSTQPPVAPAAAAASRPLPFGSQLFSRTNIIDRSIGVDANYRIKPGDQVALQIWGARTFNNILAVDMQGNIFVPEVGPVPVGGIPNGQLNRVVTSYVSGVYSDNVQVYTNLLGTQPIGVFVAGAVPNPGRYAGNRQDSVLYYLARAGGVDAGRGSYRDIRILRQGEVIGRVDLYGFLVNGTLPGVQLTDNDTIVVGPQGPGITISGDVRNSYLFEVDPARTNGASIAALAQPHSTASHVMVRGMRGGAPFSSYVPLAEFQQMRLANGDELTFESDWVSKEIVVKVTGNDDGPSSFTVPRSAVLPQVLQLIQVDPALSELGAIYIQRRSVAAQQKQAIHSALLELRRAVLTATSQTASEAGIRSQEAQLVSAFIEKAEAVEPEGRVVLSGANWQSMILEEGDTIVIPKKSDLVVVSGEVQFPQTVLVHAGWSVSDYVTQAGGVSQRGDGSNIIIHRIDGSVHRGDKPIQGGDHVIVLPAIESKAFAIFKDLVEVVYRVALSSAVVIRAN